MPIRVVLMSDLIVEMMHSSIFPKVSLESMIPITTKLTKILDTRWVGISIIKNEPLIV